MPSRHRHDGLRKLCDCSYRSWAKCKHPWHFAFKWNGEHYRFTIERQINRIVRDATGKWKRDRATLGDLIDSKTAAETERDRLRTAIREGTLQVAPVPQPQRDTLTLAALMETYRKQHVLVHRPRTAKTVGYMIGTIARTPVARADGESRAFGEWLVADVTTDAIEAYRQARNGHTGATGTNRHLEVLRHLFGWASSSKRRLAAENPFLDGTKPAIKMLDEAPRNRRLVGDEGTRLLKVCPSHLYAVVQAAVETGMRRGEILSLQWSQIRTEPRHEIYLPAAKTKTKSDRTVPISTTLKAVLDMRRTALQEALRKPDGTVDEAEFAQGYVFGNEAGERVANIRRAWQTAVLKAHGHTPEWVAREIEGRKVRTGALSQASLDQYQAIDLHFHDSRREAGSRWLDAGARLHRIQKWLGHTNISQTSTYLMADSADDDQEMRRIEEQRERLQRFATEAGKGAQDGAQQSTITDSGEPISSESLH